MRQRLRHCVWLACAALALCCAPLPAQEPPAEEPATPAETAAAESLPGEQFPQVYHLKDRDGKLRAVPNFPYEEFMELWKLQRQLAGQNERPRFSIQRLAISGVASGDSAELVAKASIRVHKSGWVGVPLRLNDVAPREPPVYAGPGDHELDFDPARNGYVVWIRGQADQTHEVTLRFVVKVEPVGAQARLRLSLPAAAVSQFQLQVPLPRAVAKVSEGTTLDAVRPLAGERTEIRAIGLAGDFELSWHPADTPVASVPPILAVTSEQSINVSRRSISTDATLTVRSLGSAFDHFRVRLPPGADYVGPRQSGVSFVALDASAAGGKLYEVTLAEKTTGPVKVRLLTERTHSATERPGAEPLELAGFEVPDARRQSGNVDVQVEANWQLMWGETNHVRPLDADGVRQGARFEYFDQPYTLPARLVRQHSRVRVVPEYVIFVEADRARLLARMKYTIRGAPKRSLRIELPGWQVDEVGPPTLVNADAALAQATGPLEVELLPEASGEFELTFEARQRIERDADRVELRIPQPDGDVAAADVAIVSADDVELLPLPDDTRSLAAKTVRPRMNLPARQQDPLYYRTDGPEARFVAAIQLHEQSISTSINTRLTLDAEQIAVDERITFEIGYQPTDRLTLRVPRSIRPERLSIRYDGEPIEAVVSRSALLVDEPLTLLHVNLPEPRIGQCELQVQYTFAQQPPPEDDDASVTVPLVIPGDGQLADNRLTVATADGLAADYSSGPWKSVESPTPPSDASALVLTAGRALGDVTLTIRSQQNPVQSSTVVERAWLQTHLTRTGRQDRAIFWLSTRREQLTVLLPNRADMRSLVVDVDGLRVEPERRPRQRELTIPMPGGTGQQHLLELRYRFSARDSEGSLRLSGPRIPSAAWLEQVYWQLVLPEDEQLLTTPTGYTHEFGWVWSGYVWRRQPTLAARELRNWVTAGLDSGGQRPPRDVFMPAGNRFLFSTVGALEPLELYTIGRAQLVLLASLPTLLLGLVLIYFPAARHPAVLFGVALLLVAMSFAAPRSALLLAQAAVLGLAMAAAAALLARMLPRIPAAMPVRESSQSLRARAVTQRYQRPGSGSSIPPSTTSDPLVPTSPEVDS